MCAPKRLIYYLWHKNLKALVIFRISKLEFIKYEFLTKSVNFGIEPAFLEGLDPGFVLIYKVCQYHSPTFPLSPKKSISPCKQPRWIWTFSNLLPFFQLDKDSSSIYSYVCILHVSGLCNHFWMMSSTTVL